MFCHTKSPKSPHGLCLWRYYPIFMSARLFPTFLVPVYDESEVTDEETDEVKRRDPVDGSILDSLMTFFNRHMCWTWFLYIVNISACWLHRICQLRIDWLIDLRKRAREAKRWTLAVRSSPLSHVMCFCSPSAPRLPAAKRRTAGFKGLSVPSSYWNMKVFSERGAPLLWSQRPCLNLASDQFPHGQRRRRRFWIMVTWVTYGRRSDFCFWRFLNDFVSFVAAHRDSSRFSDYWRWWDIQRLKITFNLRNIIFKFIDL